MIKLDSQVASLERALERVEAKRENETNSDELDLLDDESFDLEMAIESLSIYVHGR